MQFLVHTAEITHSVHDNYSKTTAMPGTYFVRTLLPLPLCLFFYHCLVSKMLLAVMWTVSEKYKIVGRHYLQVIS